MDDNIVDEVVGEFLVEAYEGLDQLDQDLIALEENHSTEILSSIFRTMHTIKGTCGFLGFGRLESVAHVAENLLSMLRDGELAVTGEITTALLATVDAVREMLATIEQTGADGDKHYPELIELLTRLQDGTPPAPPQRLGDMLVDQGVVDADAVELAFTEQALGDTRPLGEILVDHGAVAEAEIQAALTNQTEQRAATGTVSDSTIRVDVRLLDDLMNLVGELVLARNQILQLTMADETEAFSAPAQRLNLITTELQEGVMRTRMQPIGNVWNKFPRVVRDLATSFGKQVHIEMEGADTELDKTIVEAIKDPLTHLVRNSIDHGIESPEVRTGAGKSAEGRLTLRAFHEGGQVIIEIADDGKGIDVERIRDKAIDRGLITRDQAEAMSARELVNLIFLPGLSTAEAVTNVSGRGVGMDVVKTNIERIGGALDVQTEIGEGTTFRIKIPLTLAIIPALVVGCGDGQFAIPQVSLLELVRIEGDRIATEIEWIHGAPVHRLRGRLLPVVDLAAELGMRDTPLVDRDVVNMVVLQADGRRFGLVVDEITDTQEIVVKPLGNQVKDIATFAGATIMGDGRVALILDVLGLAQRAQVVSEARDQTVADATSDEVGALDGDRDTLLVVDLGAEHRGAVALSTVARLEQLERSTIEMSSRGPLIQYRGELLPLVSLSAAAGFGGGASLTWAETGLLDVVVWSGPGGQVGLVVDRIIDIVDERIVPQADGIAGSPGSFVAVVGGHVTDVLDVASLVEQATTRSTFTAAMAAVGH
ncbi:MAG: chemotaxis protein CheA [Acidimicrobiales bacterium]